jgi:phospholipase/carboxylesterase
MPLLCVETETRPQPRHTILWLHGLGADGNDFAPIVPELVGPEWPAVRFVFPHAPVRPVTVNGGLPMRAWYDIAGTDISQREDAPGVRASVQEVEALIAREAERGIPAERVILAGFSQGGAITLAAGLTHAQRLEGLVVLSSYLPLADAVMAARHAANATTPIFQAHGSHDPVVPEPLGKLARDRLTSQGYAVDWHSYPMGHQVCLEEIVDLRAWIGARLTA